MMEFTVADITTAIIRIFTTGVAISSGMSRFTRSRYTAKSKMAKAGVRYLMAAIVRSEEALVNGAACDQGLIEAAGAPYRAHYYRHPEGP